MSTIFRLALGQISQPRKSKHFFNGPLALHMFDYAFNRGQTLPQFKHLSLQSISKLIANYTGQRTEHSRRAVGNGGIGARGKHDTPCDLHPRWQQLKAWAIGPGCQPMTGYEVAWDCECIRTLPSNRREKVEVIPCSAE